MDNREYSPDEVNSLCGGGITGDMALAALRINDEIFDAVARIGGLPDDSVVVIGMLREHNAEIYCDHKPGDVLIEAFREGCKGRFKWLIRNHGEGQPRCSRRTLAMEIQQAAIALREKECPRN